jgi:uncharacterized membrane protein HdeD (DUF308 family)
LIVLNPFASRSVTRRAIEDISRGWWVLFVTGIVSLVAGGLILSVNWSVGALATFVGFALVFRGIFTTFGVPVDGSMRGWSVGLGLLEAAVGVAVWVWPAPTLSVLAAFIGWWVLFSGVMAIAGGIAGRPVLPYWVLTLTFGVIEIVVASSLLARPGLTVLAAVLAIGLWCIVYGIVDVMLAFWVKHLPRRVDEFVRDAINVTRSRPLDPTLH